MKIFRNLLWLIVSLVALQVLKVLFSKQDVGWSSVMVIVIGCFQFLIVIAALSVYVGSWIARRFFHSRRPVMHALLFFLSCVVCLECLLAWWMQHPKKLPDLLSDAYGYYYDYFQEDLLQFDERYAQYNKDLYYTLKPEDDFSFRNVEFDNTYHTNRLGMRDPDSALVYPQVICIGDSYTMGWGVEGEESFPRQLHALSGLSVANMGMASYGTARELINLGRVDTSHLRWLIIQYCCNDQDENAASISHQYKLPISSRASYEGFVRAARYSRVYFPGKYFLIIGNFFLKSLLNHIYPFFTLRWERRDWGRGQQGQAKAFLDVLDHAGIDFRKVKVIVTMMDDRRNMKGAFLAEVKRLSEEQPYKERFGDGLRVVDVASVLDKDDLYILDVHFRASGHLKIARALYDAMK